MHIEKLLENLAKSEKLKEMPEKNKDGIYQLKLPPNFQIGISQHELGIFLSSIIIPIPKEGGKEALYIYLMKANLIGQGTGGGAIGIDPTESYFTLSQTLPLEVSYPIFKETLEDFLNYIYYWKEEIVRFNKNLF